MNKDSILEALKVRAKYFHDHISDSELFRPEYEVSIQINTLLESLEVMTRNDAQQIIELLNNLDSVEHYDGSGWCDYKIQLSAYLRCNGYLIEFDNSKMRLTQD